MIAAWLFIVSAIDPSAQKLAKDLQAAADRGDTTFTVTQADYEFGSTPLKLSGATNLHIAFSGSTVWFDLGGGIDLHSCSGVTVEGLTIDYSPVYAQGSLVYLNGSSLVAEFDNDFMLPDPTTENFFKGQVKVAFWDEQQRLIRDEADPGAVNIFATTFKRMSEAASTAAFATTRFEIGFTGNVKKSLPPVQQAIKAGAKVSVTAFPRGFHHSVVMTNCTGMAIVNSSIYGGSSMGVVESMGGGGNTYSRLRVSRRPDRKSGKFRLLGVNADGFHSSSNAKGPTLKDSEIAFTGDDLGNICCGMSLVLAAAGSSSRDAMGSSSSRDAMGSSSSRDAMGSSSSRDAMGDASQSAAFAFYFVDTGSNLKLARPGDTVSFYHLNSLAPQGKAVVHAVTPTHDKSVIAQQVKAFDTLQAPPYSAHLVSSRRGLFGSGRPAYLLNMTMQMADSADGPSAALGEATGDGPSAALGEATGDGPSALWSLAVLDSSSNSGAAMHNCNLHDGYARVWMIKGSDAAFVGNKFARSGGVHVGPEQGWFEGNPGITNVLIENNELEDIGIPGITVDPSVLGNVTLVNNTNVTTWG
jgi:hypothetical protein